MYWPGFVFFLMAMFSNSACSNFDASNVLDMIAKNSNKSLNFVEIHSETFFTKEIEVTGVVLFGKSGTMSKYIATPSKSEMHIVNNTLSLVSSEGVKSMSLDNYPVLASSVNAIRWLLLGEKNKILENYSINYSNKGNDWVINLIPVDKEILLKISTISITGSLGNIAIIMLIKTNGTSITTTFSKL
ncbi:MAG: hypothetical protein HOA38_03100 [Candidatus Marinimicrobia bacterium]|jgi:hypothetical protein|nr:hypothetical protein [Candidatus Neomarinimicrobiota bacterium]